MRTNSGPKGQTAVQANTEGSLDVLLVRAPKHRSPSSQVHSPTVGATGLKHRVVLSSRGGNCTCSKAPVLQGCGRPQAHSSNRKKNACVLLHISQPPDPDPPEGTRWLAGLAGAHASSRAVSSTHPLGAPILQKVPSPGKPLLNTTARKAPALTTTASTQSLLWVPQPVSTAGSGVHPSAHGGSSAPWYCLPGQGPWENRSGRAGLLSLTGCQRSGHARTSRRACGKWLQSQRTRSRLASQPTGQPQSCQELDARAIGQGTC